MICGPSADKVWPWPARMTAPRMSRCPTFGAASAASGLADHQRIAERTEPFALAPPQEFVGGCVAAQRSCCGSLPPSAEQYHLGGRLTRSNADRPGTTSPTAAR
jgi:hypothetical protein